MIKLDQFAAANEAAIDQFAYFAKLSLGNIEKFAEIGLGAARQSVDDATRHAQSLAGARDVHEVIAISSAAVEPTLKRAYTFSRTAYETAAATGDEMKRVLEKNAAQFNKAAIDALEQALQYAPAGSENAVASLKTAIGAAQASYDNLVSLNKKIYDTVEQNVATVQAAARPTKRTSKRRK
jgi:phasin family protein